MADVSIKATLSGAQEAQRGLESLAQATKGLTNQYENQATIEANLARVAKEYQAEIARRSESTQKLKDHTADLVKKFNEQQASEQAAKTTTAQLTNSLVDLAITTVTTTFSLAALVGTFKEIVTAGREADLAVVRLDGILKATGNTVGLTSRQLIEMSDALAKGTRFDNTQIKEAMTILLTFKGVQGDVFESALKHAQNLSELFGIGLPMAARLLGRALENPIEGMQALRRYIGELDETTQKQIKSFVEQGKLYEANKVLIGALDGKVKDFAETVGKSAPAAFDRMKIAWRNLLEELGKGQDGGIWDSMTKSLDNWTKTFSNYHVMRKQRDMEAMADRLRELQGFEDWERKGLDAYETVGEERARLNARMRQLQNEAREQEEKEQQDKDDAALAAFLENDRREQAALKESREKRLKEEAEAREKAFAGDAALTMLKIEDNDRYTKDVEENRKKRQKLEDEETAAKLKGYEQSAQAEIAGAKQMDENLKAYEKNIKDKEDADQKHLEKIYENILTAEEKLRKQYESDLDLLNATLGQQKDNQEQYYAYLGRLVLKYEKDREALARKESEDTIKIWDNMVQNIQRTLGDQLYEVMQGNFRNIGRAFSQMLQHMLADALAANLMKAIFGSGPSGGLNILGFLSKIGITAAAGSSGMAAAVPASNRMAEGGDFIVDKPTLFLAGEAGRERATFSGANKTMGRGSISINYAPSIQIDAASDRSQVYANVSRMIQQGHAELVDTLERGGYI